MPPKWKQAPFISSTTNTVPDLHLTFAPVCVPVSPLPSPFSGVLDVLVLSYLFQIRPSVSALIARRWAVDYFIFFFPLKGAADKVINVIPPADRRLLRINQHSFQGANWLIWVYVYLFIYFLLKAILQNTNLPNLDISFNPLPIPPHSHFPPASLASFSPPWRLSSCGPDRHPLFQPKAVWGLKCKHKRSSLLQSDRQKNRERPVIDLGKRHNSDLKNSNSLFVHTLCQNINIPPPPPINYARWPPY